MCRSAFTSFMSRGIPLAFKNEALALLPYVLIAKDVDTVKSKLSEMIIYDFPSSSKDLPVGSTV